MADALASALPARLAACRTDADQYRVQIDAENRLTPQEVLDLAADLPALPAPAQGWVQRLAGFVTRVRPTPQPFRRRAIAEHVTLYEGIAQPGAPRELIIGFTGLAFRLMLPVAPMLQLFPAERCDVLVLGDPARLHFLSGIPGYAPDPPRLTRRLARDLRLSRYAALRCFGTSAGGMAALAYGASLGARVAMSLGGAHPAVISAARIGGGQIDRYALDKLIAAAPRGRTRFLCVFGADCPRDRLRTRLQAFGIPGARAVSVAGVTHHGVVAGLFLQGALLRFFEEMLLSDDPPEGEIWRP
jgi:hypothetical protein